MNSFKSAPSWEDLGNAGSQTHYVFDMKKRKQKVYIYNGNGVVAIVKMKNFAKMK